MKMSSLQIPALMAAVFFAGSGFSVLPVYADDTAVVDAVQTTVDAIAPSDSTGQAAGIVSDADEAAADTAAGLPKFKNRQERRDYLQKLRQENPEQFKQIVQKRQEQWAKNHPEMAKKFQERKQWMNDHPEEAQKMKENFKAKLQERKEAMKQAAGERNPNGPARDYRENRLDRREDVRDRRENVRDRAEDVRDRREDRWDAKHDGGKWDKIEDRIDRREDVRDHKEDVRDRVENKLDRRENRYDATHGSDQGRPGNAMGRPGAGRRAAKANR